MAAILSRLNVLIMLSQQQVSAIAKLETSILNLRKIYCDS